MIKQQKNHLYLWKIKPCFTAHDFCAYNFLNDPENMLNF